MTDAAAEPAPARTQPSGDSAAGRRLVLLAVVLLALNLRPAAVSVGPVLAEVIAGLDMTPTGAGLLTALPVVAFALFGATAPYLARSLGIHRTIVGALMAVTLGLAARTVVESSLPFLGWSLVALAGMATANVLLPSLVKLHFPDHIGPATALYTTALAIGLTAALMLTVPAADALGGWRVGLGLWAALALVAALPWLLLAARDRHAVDRPRGIRLVDVARTRLGMAMALFFGLQSMQAYAVFGWFAQLWRDAGYSPAQAGALVGLVAAVSIPLSVWIPRLAAARDDQRRILLWLMVTYPLGYGGLLIAPYSGAILWAVLVGIGLCAFPLALSLIALRTRTSSGTVALSGWTQAAGYLIAFAGPLTVGALYDVTGGWTWPLIFLLALTVPQLLTGLHASRPAHLEDHLTPTPPRSTS